MLRICEAIAAEFAVTCCLAVATALLLEPALIAVVHICVNGLIPAGPTQARRQECHHAGKGTKLTRVYVEKDAPPADGCVPR